MQLDVLKPELVERLLALEQNAAHLSIMADVAAAYAHVARGKADAAQATLSACKVFIALLPDDCRLELRAPKPDAADPAVRLGVRAHLPSSRSQREHPACIAPSTAAAAAASSRTPPANRETTPTTGSAAGPARG
jgi:hypothetical protein